MPSLVKLDYDMPIYEAVPLFNERWKMVSYILQLHEETHCFVRSQNKNTHCRLRIVETLEPLEIVCLQAVLGSDPKRETWNLRRVRLGQKNWNILFEGKDK